MPSRHEYDILAELVGNSRHCMEGHKQEKELNEVNLGLMIRWCCYKELTRKPKLQPSWLLVTVIKTLPFIIVYTNNPTLFT